MNSVYPIDSAGALAVYNVPIAAPQESIVMVKDRLEAGVAEYVSIDYIYILDSTHKILGVISIKELLLSPSDARIEDQMERSIVSVQGEADQEGVAQMAVLYSIKAIPVVNKMGEFLGVVTSDQIMHILQHESVEDTLRMAGMQIGAGSHRETVLTGSWLLHFGRRLPWLVVGLLGGVVAAVVIQQFEVILATHVIIAAFIPAVVYIADAVGSQTQTIYVRALALDAGLPTKRYVLREALVNGALAVVLGFGLTLIAALTFTTLYISMLLGLAIFVTVLLALCTSILVPYTFSRLGVDPAIASGPLATILRDVLSLLAYLLLVVWLL